MPLTSFKNEKIWYDKLKGFAHYFKPPEDLKSNSLCTWVVVAHYKWTFAIVTGFFMSILTCWYATSPMECIVKSVDAATKVPDYQEDICLSYPFTYTGTRDSYPVRERVYALHYRWIHWIMLILLPMYYAPILCRKYLEYSQIFSYLKSIKDTDLKDNHRRKKISAIVNNHILTTGWVYRNILLLHFVTLLVDILAFAFVDVSLQNKFARLFPLDYPFSRWPRHFNDSLSLTFPPFVECKIGPDMMLLLDMEETFGCHLTLMILYDKMFILLWVLMSLLTLWTLCTLIYYILLGMCSCLKKSLIFHEGCGHEINVCLENLPVGTILVMNCFKNVVITDEYKKALRTIVFKINTLKKRETNIFQKMPDPIGFEKISAELGNSKSSLSK